MSEPDPVRDVPPLPQSDPSRIPRAVPGLPRQLRRPFLYWVTEALTQFANGCFDGMPAGGFVGTGGAIIAHNLPGVLDWVVAGILGFGSAVLTAAAHGAKAFSIWHRSHPMPNPVFPPTKFEVEK